MAKVILRNGTVENLELRQYKGAAMTGQATMYAFHPATYETLWLKPVQMGDETIWLEDDDKVGSFLWEKFPEEMNTDDNEEIVLRLLDRLYRLEN